MLLTSIILFCIATALFVVATSIVWRTHIILQRGVSTYGTVVERELLDQPGPKSCRFVEYNLLTGELVTITRSRSLWRRRLQPGDRVPVVFVPDQPEAHRILGFAELWSVPVAIAVAGIVFAAVALAALLTVA